MSRSMKPNVKRENDKHKKLQRLIDRLDEANPQHRIAKEKYKAQLAALNKKAANTESKLKLNKVVPLRSKNQKQHSKEKLTNASLLLSSLVDTSYANRALNLPSESLSNADQETQNKNAFQKTRASSVAEVEHKLSTIRRLIERRAAIHAKMTKQLEVELSHVIKAREAMTLLKCRIDKSFASLERDLVTVKGRQIMEVKGINEQLKVVENQSSDNAELEKCARQMSDTMVKNQVSPIGLSLLSPLIDAIKGVLYQLAMLRDAYKMVSRNPSQ